MVFSAQEKIGIAEMALQEESKRIEERMAELGSREEAVA